MKKSKLFKTLAVLGACICAPLLFNGCKFDKDNNLQFRVQDGYIQWCSDDNNWEDIITIDALLEAFGDDIIGPQGPVGPQGAVGPQGVAGKQVVFNVSDTHIQWKYNGNANWNNLIALSKLKGKDGDDATVSTHTVTYNYFVDEMDMSSILDTTPAFQHVKSNEWIQNMPKINDEFKKYFDGWCIENTEKIINDYDFIGGNITLKLKPNDSFYEGINYVGEFRLCTEESAGGKICGRSL